MDEFLRKTTLVVRKTFSSIFDLSEKKVRELDEKIPAVFSKEILLFQPKILLENYFFLKIMFSFHFFSTLSYLFSISVLKLCCRNPKRLIWKPNKKFCGEKKFFLKLCRFVNFADTEFPSDFRRSFSTVLSKVYPECSVESYQQKHTFGDISNFLHVFGHSVKKMRTVGEKASQELQMRNLSIWMIFWERQRLLLGKLFPPFSISQRKKFGNLMKKFRQLFPKRFYFSSQKFCSKIIFSWIFCFFFHFFSLLSYLFSVSLLKIWCRNLKSLIWKPNKKFCGGIFFLKLCSFLIFADTEFPSDFRRSSSTGLPKLYSECSVESFQQKHTFGDISNFLHVFGLSVKKMRTVGEKASQKLQMKNPCF